ncbi:hypothetical protein Bca4012_036446 [Brassica carinata]
MCSDLGGFFLKLVAEQGAVVRLSQFASHSLSSPLKVCNHNIKLETVGEFDFGFVRVRNGAPSNLSKK